MEVMGGLPVPFMFLLLTFGLFCKIFSYSYVIDNLSKQHINSISKLNYGQRKLFASGLYNDSSLDDPVTRSALIEIYNSTNGPAWTWVNASTVLGIWGTPGLSYCMWYGVQCCLNTPLSPLVSCVGDRSVSTLTLDSYGLQGTIPSQLGNLNQLAVLSLAQNPLLLGRLPPETSLLTKLLWLSVEGTGLNTCTSNAANPSLPTSECALPSYLSLGPVNTSYIASTSSLRCPTVLLNSFTNYTRGLPPSLINTITSPYPPTNPPGSVLSGPAFTLYYHCECIGGSNLQFLSNVGSCVAPSLDNFKYILAIVLVAVLPMLCLSLLAFVFIKHRAAIRKLLKKKVQRMDWKRKRMPGMPDIALQDGQGTLAMADVMVTWVFTDVSGR
ncbi:hypothetical protein CEUSTIGMA_g8968.t1 [Chlamydomonas eustigma]|uniref:Leucine-rich repeat-containing N-terminal plant-type domain-containing protein n=1 Tax=Chlamydomonas eustigma TaxID=1157962 RepID=A0A250XFH9_9CHLO|nr:hypothetical protein CEUSTIGMA_g8968.t1 [Chlamydomonas eustigma]|eukprot:GAX81540.1 hypothetical protein CEUSTIGMA_g8968.t1 [Chlamydomonas eustigma]